MRNFAKLFFVFCTLFLSIFFVSFAKAEVYGYILTINASSLGNQILNGQEISFETAQDGSLNFQLQALDPENPKNKLNVDKWDVILESPDNSQWNLENISKQDNIYKTNCKLSSSAIANFVTIKARAYIGSHQTNDVSIKIFVANPQELAPATQTTATKVPPIANTENAVNRIVTESTKTIPPLSIAATAIISIGIASSMGALSSALVVNGAAPFIPPLLRLILLLPFSGFLKRSRKKWGKVISQDTHEPLRLLFLELIMVEKDGYEQIVQKTHTDKNGEYAFDVKKGEYKIQSAITGAKIESLKGNFYHEGDIVKVEKFGEGAQVNPIVLSSIGKNELSRAIYFSFFKSFEGTFFFIGVAATLIGTLISLYVLFLRPNLTSTLILLVYVVLWFFAFYQFSNRKFSGRVIDKITRMPVAFAVVRIMDEQGDKFIRGAITNEDGRFSLVLKHGKYMVLAGKEDYQIVRPKMFKTSFHTIGLIEMIPR